MAGNSANPAHLKTSASLSPGVDHSVGIQCQTSLAPRNNASAKIQFPTSTKRKGHWRTVKPRYLMRGSRRTLALRCVSLPCSMECFSGCFAHTGYEGFDDPPQADPLRLGDDDGLAAYFDVKFGNGHRPCFQSEES